MHPGLATAVCAVFGMTLTGSPARAAEVDSSATVPEERRPRPRVAAPT
jgi:hypothetical protein